MGSYWISQYCLGVCFVLAILDLSITNGLELPAQASSNLTKISRQTGNDGGVCTLPEHPDGGYWKTLNYDGAKPGEKVDVNTLLSFHCNQGYKLSSENGLSVCLPAGWNPQPPTCLKLCPPLYSNSVTKVRCYDERNLEIKCTDATTGATAKFQCETYYELSDQSSTTRYCWSERWNQPPPLCIPVCGEKKVSTEPLIANGKEVETGDYPWVTAVYQKVTNEYNYVCGGSILSQRVILTAAHCVTDDFGDALDVASIVVAVGKYYNEYRDKRDTLAQYSKVEKIVKHESYKGAIHHYACDIALLLTKETLLLSEVVQPVCFLDLPQIHLTPSLGGVVTGWGFTSASEPSDSLREVEVFYKNYTSCYQELPKEIWSNDKLCAGYYNKSTAVCKGDAGHGLVFKDQQRNRYFIHGILIVLKDYKVARVHCGIETPTLFTKVATHYDWIVHMSRKLIPDSL